HRLAGARSTGHSCRALVIAVDESALLGVEKDAPGAEVAFVDDALELLVGLDPREGELAGRLLESLDKGLVGLGVGARLIDPELLVGLEPGGGQLAGRLLPPVDQGFVGLVAGARRIDPELLVRALDRQPGGKVQHGKSLPLGGGGAGDREEAVLVASNEDALG